MMGGVFDVRKDKWQAAAHIPIRESGKMWPEDNWGTERD